MGGDCGKNYFTYLYHSIYDSGIWFQGMNYPYGEHIIYADGQPVLSCLLNHFKPMSVSTALAIMNLLLGLSYVLAIIFTWYILRRFGVAPFVAIVFACLINVSCPIVFRIKAHFALAYLCWIPMLFYLSILYHQSGRWKWLIWMLVMGLIASFMHLYVGAIIFVWSAFYAAGYLILIKKDFKQKIAHLAPFLTVSAVLFAAIKIVIALTDPLKDRPGFPLNELDNVTKRRDIFTSVYSPIWDLFHEKTWYNRVSDGGEGYTYLGIIAILAIAISIGLGLYRRISKRSLATPVVSENAFSPVWLFIGTGALLMAMGIPFIWNMRGLLSHLSIFRQFRAMGRFSWIFYYVFAIYAAVVISYWYQKLLVEHRRSLAYTILLLSFSVWSFEASGYIRHIRRYVEEGKPNSDRFFSSTEQNWPQYLSQHHYNPTDFQAIILLPLFVSGSEKLWVGGDPSIPFSIGIKASLQMHLPIVDVMMSRTSWSITKKQVKLAGGPYTDKAMFHDLTSTKPFLLILPNASEIDVDQRYLIGSSDYIGDFADAKVYVCHPERILATDLKIARNLSGLIPQLNTGDTILNTHGSCYINHFDEMGGANIYFGTGAWPAIKPTDSVFAHIPVKPEYPNQEYELSCWFLVGDEDYRSPYIHVDFMDSTGKSWGSADACVKWSVANDGMWFRASAYFRIPGTCSTISCKLYNEPSPTYISMDELVLRPTEAFVISKTKEGMIMVNNHKFKLVK